MAVESVLVRPARPGDAAALNRMVARCSPRTRYERFHGVVEEIPPEYLRRCLHGDGQEAVVAETVTGELAGLASTGPVPGEPAGCELGVLVEDRWQRKQIGRLLTSELLDRARARGLRFVRLELCRLQPGLLDYVVTHLPVVGRQDAGCDVTVDVSPVLPRPAPVTARPRRPSAAPRRGAPART